jgi:hypothetical protein
MSQACEELIKAMPKDVDSLTSFSYPILNDGIILEFSKDYSQWCSSAPPTTLKIVFSVINSICLA